MPATWTDVLLAYLHDPPDKALSVNASRVPAHESRRLAFAKSLLGDDEVSKAQFKQKTAQVDVLASMVERLPMPKSPHVNVVDGQLNIGHPLSGVPELLDVPELTVELIEQQRQCLLTISEASRGSEVERNRFLAIWRLWLERLTKVDRAFTKLPAETRNPDHTIWQHLDTTAAFQAATSGGQKPALLTFALGPVQRFIEASRSVRDLWSSSMILSWLAYRSMLPIIEELGPTALVYPSLRGNPIVDLWLRNEVGLKDVVAVPNAELRMTPCLPHRFLAVVPWGEGGAAANAIADRCRQATHQAWLELAAGVHEELQSRFKSHCVDWDKRWDNQVRGYFQADVAVTLLELGDPQNTYPEPSISDAHEDQILARLLAGQDSFSTAFADAERVREMIRSVPKENRHQYRQDHAGRWQYRVELVTRSLAAQRSIRNVPISAGNSSTGERVPQKCSLLGTYEQMGPDDLDESREFWKAGWGVSIDGVGIRKGEALSAVALVKRFAAPAFLRHKLEIEARDARYSDTATTAASDWLRLANLVMPEVMREIGLSKEPELPIQNLSEELLDAAFPGRSSKSSETSVETRWVEWLKKAAKILQREPPSYYAILKLDGDDLGGWLRGEKSPKVREAMHPDLVAYYEQLGDTAKAGLDARRPVNPTLHASISSALSNFALYAVPAIVAKHHGTTIYSGGDDALILLPTSTALACSMELRQAYTSDWYTRDGRDYLMMGSRATISGGMVVVHAKDDLRLALQDARAAEEEAKGAGKDALCIRVRRRSGEHTSALCSWEYAKTVDGWTQAFLPKRESGSPAKVLEAEASDRWTYHLRSLESTLAGLSDEAIAAEIRRQVNRAEQATRRRLGEPERPKEHERAGAILAQSFLKYRDMIEERRQSLPEKRRQTINQALQGFIHLCQTASFLARGRDR